MSDSDDHETFSVEHEPEMALQAEETKDPVIPVNKELDEYNEALQVLKVKDNFTDEHIARVYEEHLDRVSQGDKLFNDGQLELNMLMRDH
jgi:hypothetical protein